MGGLVSEPISPVGGDIFERYHEAGAVQFGEVSPMSFIRQRQGFYWRENEMRTEGLGKRDETVKRPECRATCPLLRGILVAAGCKLQPDGFNYDLMLLCTLRMSPEALMIFLSSPV